MAKARVADRHERHRSCQKCGASLGDLRLGGIGDWYNRIQCLRCGHYWTAPANSIAELVYEQYPEISSPARAALIMKRAQADYEAEILRQQQEREDRR